MDKQWYYERNTELMASPVNRTFEELLWMTQDEFRQWVVDLRKTVVQLWDEKGQPPRVGYDTAEIIEQFQNMEPTVVQAFEQLDEYTGTKDVIRCTSNLGNAVNQFFPSMMATRINYTKDPNAGKSIYDYFARPELLETFIKYATRHFKRDSFYHFSRTLGASDISKYGVLPVAATGKEWILEFESGHYRSKGWDYWLAPREEDATYTGYNEELKGKQYLRVSKDEIETLGATIPDKCKTNVDWSKGESYTIRVFERGNRVFPAGLKAFRVSFSQYAVNWPPLAAKYIYERYTEPWKKESTIYCWDPSSGWGGRLLGAMSVKDDRHITYLGNDPNTDHNTTPGRTKYHEIYDFYRTHVQKGGLFGAEHTGFKFWQLGSEVMQFDPDFQQYKGKLSLVFTSPPYFSKERYSEDPAQSCIKFDTYEAWRDGFLTETLRTAYGWLRPGGIIAWNIANATFGGIRLPLETDSCSILNSLGMKHIETLKLALAQMPGGNRIDSTSGIPKTEHFCKVNNLWLKYEPILIWRKPL
jgi:hypothetical protein